MIDKDSAFILARDVRNCRKCTRKRTKHSEQSCVPEPFLGEGCFGAQILVLGMYPGLTYQSNPRVSQDTADSPSSDVQAYLDRRLYPRQMDWGNKYFPELASYLQPLVDGTISRLNPYHDFYYSDFSRCPGQPGNEMYKIWAKEEMHNCLDYSIRLLDIINPRLIVFVGKSIPTELIKYGINIDKLFGDSRHICIYHPSYRFATEDQLNADRNFFWSFARKIQFRKSSNKSNDIHSKCPFKAGNDICSFYPELVASRNVRWMHVSGYGNRKASSSVINNIPNMAIAHTKLDNSGGYTNTSLQAGFESSLTARGFYGCVYPGTMLLRYTSTPGLGYTRGYFQLMQVKSIDKIKYGRIWIEPCWIKTFLWSLPSSSAIYNIPEIRYAFHLSFVDITKCMMDIITVLRDESYISSEDYSAICQKKRAP